MIYAASDLHGNLPAVPRDAELLLLAGDICPDFRPYGRRGGFVVDESGTQQLRWIDNDFREWLNAHGVRTVAIWGNHDFVGEKSLWPPVRPMPQHFTLLQDSKVQVDVPHVGVLDIYGTPWVPGLPYWAFYGTERKLQLRADAIPHGIDVLMTHGPPHHAGDYIPTSEKQRNKYGNFGGSHVGDPTLNEAIERVRPIVTLCGHIHEDRGYHEVEGSPVINVAAVDEVYRLHENPWTVLHGL